MLGAANKLWPQPWRAELRQGLGKVRGVKGEAGMVALMGLTSTGTGLAPGEANKKRRLSKPSISHHIIRDISSFL